MSAPSSNRIPVLQMIFSKIRRLTGSADSYQLPDVPDPNNVNSVGLSDYVNSFYYYDLPAQFRSLKLKDFYTFDTVAGIDTYAFDSENYTTVEQPAYCMNREIPLFNDPYPFYTLNYNWQQQTNFTTGNGTVGPYSGFTTASPILRSVNNNPSFADNPNYQAGRLQNILITVNNALGDTLNVTDDGEGNLIGDVAGGPVPVVPGSAGTIDYETGEISGLLFNTSVISGATIQIQYIPFTANTPLSILFYQNQFVLRPVPNQGYTIKLVAYRQPSQALASTAAFEGNPELSEWWELIAVGAAKKIYEDRLDVDGVALMDKMLKERYALAETRTYAQLGKQRIGTIFSDQLYNTYGSGPFGPGGLGSV